MEWKVPLFLLTVSFVTDLTFGSYYFSEDKDPVPHLPKPKRGLQPYERRYDRRYLPVYRSTRDCYYSPTEVPTIDRNLPFVEPVPPQLMASPVPLTPPRRLVQMPPPPTPVPIIYSPPTPTISDNILVQLVKCIQQIQIPPFYAAPPQQIMYTRYIQPQSPAESYNYVPAQPAPLAARPNSDVQTSMYKLQPCYVREYY